MSPTTEVNVPNFGVLRGSIDKNRKVAVFKNVPYATVPERWRPAVKAHPWTGVRDATQQGPVHPQAPSQFPLNMLIPESYKKLGDGKFQYGLDIDEVHCLNLNIFVPLEALQETSGPVPVMAFIHGGGFAQGHNGATLYDASNFVSHSAQLNQPVIVVVVNYRLNVFGFLASKELEQEMEESVASSRNLIPDYDRTIGNWGLMDQKLAFEWVRENIGAFGGNPRNVTAFGSSAGAVSIHYHTLCPAHFGLFDHAIIQSGTAFTTPASHVHTAGQTLFNDLLNHLKIPLDLDAREKMRRLRATPVEELSAAGNQIPMNRFTPYYDHNGAILPSKVPIGILALDPNAYDPNLKSVLIGDNKDEGSLFAMIIPQRTRAAWPGIVKRLVPSTELLPAFEAAYGNPETDEEVSKLVAQFLGDSMTFLPNYRVAQTLQTLQTQKPGRFEVHHYHFDSEIQKLNQLIPGLGAMHGIELPYVFGPPCLETVLTEQELGLSRQLQKVWISIANENLVQSKSADEVIVFTKDSKVERMVSVRFNDKEKLVFWNKASELAAQQTRDGFHEREV
ncbi:hypothetical protein EMPS_01688 [Entomortierella parvispora]|uniref:Carboxylesterase type B domain-containing protein n=1 Tax=Entomortierella parvispora TaxID=205924 RepID=A0A9P3H3F6_9FUNG|nr:hypothetical protein EMPS_01688 [Entomortierella parvispora]